jgi:membrane-bound lytic murein transglycosylase D
VAFWRKVYSVWGRSVVVIHDNRHLDTIYEILEIPGAGESLTADQKAWIAGRRAHWQDSLYALESKLNSGAGLSADDRAVAVLLEANRGDFNTAIRGANERVRSQRGMRERFLRGLEIGARYERRFRKIFRDAGLPEELAYLPHVESSFQASARSSAGAVGVWQFTRGAAEKFLPMGDGSDPRLDPVASTQGAARYLRHAYSHIGNWPMAITAYNHGINGMKRAHSRYGHDFMRMVEEYDSPLFGFASRNYYAEFLAALEIATRPERYFSELSRYSAPYPDSD